MNEYVIDHPHEGAFQNQYTTVVIHDITLRQWLITTIILKLYLH